MSVAPHPLASILSTAKHFSAQEGKAAETVRLRKAIMERVLMNCMLLLKAFLCDFGMMSLMFERRGGGVGGGIYFTHILLRFQSELYLNVMSLI